MREFESILDPELKELLQSVGPVLNQHGLILVGGTALALQLNHRRSIDLDFFGKDEFDAGDLSFALESELGNQHSIEIVGQDRNSLSLLIDNIKVDILRHHYPANNAPIERAGVKISSIQDIAAMKLNAIVNRGAKKDFFDIYFLLREFSLPEILEWYCRKYQTHDPFFVIKSLNYFEDAELEPAPVLNEYVSWEEIKSELRETTKDFSLDS